MSFAVVVATVVVVVDVVGGSVVVVVVVMKSVRLPSKKLKRLKWCTGKVPLFG